MTGPDLLAAFSALTGIRFAIGAHYAQAQAIALCDAGFGVRELEMVVLWTKREMAQPRSPYKQSSLSWRTLMGRHGDGDEFVCFQERLGLAQAAVAKGWRPVFKLSAPEPVKEPLRALPAPEPVWDAAAWEAGKAERDAARLQLLRKGAA